MADQFQRHFAASAEIDASVHEVFAYLDNPARLSTHMTRSSWMMGGGTMQTWMDEGAGARVGSRIRLSGKAFGLSLSVDEAVMQREPPTLKTWETLGEPKLLVIGRYRMGFQITDAGTRAKLQVFIDYDLPRKGLARMFGWLLSRVYAAWCVKSMLADAGAHFGAQATEPGRALPGKSA